MMYEYEATQFSVSKNQVLQIIYHVFIVYNDTVLC